MKKFIDKIHEIKTGNIGVIVFETERNEMIISESPDLIVPLASAAKIGIGYCIAKWVEKGEYNWTDEIDGIRFNPDEDSDLLYPHFQGRTSLPLQDAVEVMITCHDSIVADRIVEHCGGWQRINEEVRKRFSNLRISQNPFDEVRNVGPVHELFQLIRYIYDAYRDHPQVWTPIVNGMVRQQGEVNGVPAHHLTHMTGGLPTVIVHIGIIGSFHENPLLYVIGAKDLPNRYEDMEADEKVLELLGLLYEQAQK